jgi:hypothetical protein
LAGLNLFQIEGSARLSRAAQRIRLGTGVQPESLQRLRTEADCHARLLPGPGTGKPLPDGRDGRAKLREDVPINLGAEYKKEALELRNKLLTFRFLTFRFRNYGKCRIDPGLVDRTVEPRLAQVYVPLLSVIEDAAARQRLRELMRQYDRELVADRGMDMEARVLEIIRELQQSSYESGTSIKEITQRFAEKHSDDYERKITPHWGGQIIRRKLGLKTEKRHGSYVVGAAEGSKLSRLFERYGISDAMGDLEDSGDFEKGGESASLVSTIPRCGMDARVPASDSTGTRQRWRWRWRVS